MALAPIKAVLPPWHAWGNTVAYALLAALLVFAALQLALADNHSRLSRIFRGGTLRGTLVVGLTLLGSLPVLALGVVLVERTAEARVERASHRLVETSAAIRHSIDYFIDKHVSGVASAASVIGTGAQFDRASMEKWLLVYHGVYADFLTMLHADARGDIVAATSNMTGFLAAVPDLTGHNVGDRGYFRQPMSDGEPFVSRVFRGRSLGSDPIVAVSAPLSGSAGEPIGIIEGSLDLRAFEDIDRNRSNRDEARLVLTDQDGRVIYSSADADLDVLAVIADSPLLAQRSVAGLNRAYVYESGDALPHLAAAQMTGNGWFVHLSMPLSGIHAQVAADYRSAAMFGLVTCVFALFLSRAIVRRVSQSIADMDDAIDDLSLEGDAAKIRTPWNTFAEFRPMFQHLRDRSVDLQKSYRRLQGSIATGDKLRSELNQAIALKEVEIAERTADLEEANERLAGLSKRDALTGIANRREFEAFGGRLWKKAAVGEMPVSIVLLDIDYFKLLNDQLGHQKGDECLREVAAALRKCATRADDLVARYGGEEFVAVLGDTTLDNALVVAGRMRKVIAGLEIPHPGSAEGIVTISCGVATAVPSMTPLEQVLREADESLYAAKHDGRNRVSFSSNGKYVTFEEDGVSLDATGVLSILGAGRS